MPDTGPGGPAVVRSRVVRLNRSVLDSWGGPAAIHELLRLNLFADTVLELRNARRVNRGGQEGEVWRGRTADELEDKAVFTLRGSQLTANVNRSNGEFYQIRALRGRLHLVQQVSYSGFGAFQDAEPPPSGAENRVEAVAAGTSATVNMAGASVIDVLIAYTPSARVEAGGTTAIQNLAQFTIDEMNQGNDNSGVNIEYRLVHTAEFVPTQAETAATSGFLSYVTSQTSNPEIDAVHDLRDLYGADIVGIWIDGPGSNGGIVGRAWVMGSPGPGFAGSAFSVSEVNFVDGPAYTFAHEVGHNMGSGHERGNGGGGAYSYSWGYKKTTGSNRFHTIMSYQCSGCVGLNNWSNPNVSYFGQPTGVASSQSDSADNRMTHNNTGPIASAFRAAVTPVNQPPTANSVTPSSGSGPGATFTYSVSDANGFQDLSSMLIAFNESYAWPSSCMMSYSVGNNQLRLWRDDSTGWVGTMVVGSPGTLQNSKCTINLGGSSASGSGTTLSLSLAIQFNQPGLKKTYVYAIDSTGLNSSVIELGSWNVAGVGNQPPTADSVTPSTGTGSGATFTYSISDPNGYQDLSSMLIAFNESYAWPSSCMMSYTVGNNQLRLWRDDSTGWVGSMAVGSAGTLQNSKCTINLGASSASGSGATLSLSLAIQFNQPGLKKTYVYAIDKAGLNSSLIELGSWTVAGVGNQPPTANSVTPSSGTGSGATFTYSISDPNGYQDLSSMLIAFNESYAWPNSCMMSYSVASNRLWLWRTDSTGWVGSMAVGSAGTLQNSKCTINLGASTASGSGTTLSLSLAIQFNQPGLKKTYVYAIDNAGLNSSLIELGSWTAN